MFYIVGIKHLCGDRMKLFDKNGEELYKTNHKTLKTTLAHCARKGVDLTGLYIRNANLRNSRLDGLVAPQSTFWGCDFYGSDLGYGDFRGTDFRTSDFEDVCFSGSDLTGANMRGAYFGGAIFDGARLDYIQISCPSFWPCDVHLAQSMKNIIFSHRGEKDIVLNDMPLILHQNGHQAIVMNGLCLWRGKLYGMGSIDPDLAKDLFAAKVQMEKFLICPISQSAKKPMPKIVEKYRGF
jgi:hypothetical protein